MTCTSLFIDHLCCRLQNAIQTFVMSQDTGIGANEKCYAVAALLWLQQAQPGGPQLVSPGALLKAIVHGGRLGQDRILFSFDSAYHYLQVAILC